LSTWTTPATFTASSTLTAATLNAEIKDHLNWLKGAFDQLNVTTDTAKAKITPALVGCEAYNSSAITLTTAILTVLPMNSERFDSDAFHDTATNNSRLTIPTGMGGYYLIGGKVQWAANLTGNRLALIFKNNATNLAYNNYQAGNVEARCTPVTLSLMAATDYVELYAYQNSGGNLDVEVNAEASPVFWLHRISST
jgi:hypothetical protein